MKPRGPSDMFATRSRTGLKNNREAHISMNCLLSCHLHQALPMCRNLQDFFPASMLTDVCRALIIAVLDKSELSDQVSKEVKTVLIMSAINLFQTKLDEYLRDPEQTVCKISVVNLLEIVSEHRLLLLTYSLLTWPFDHPFAYTVWQNYLCPMKQICQNQSIKQSKSASINVKLNFESRDVVGYTQARADTVRLEHVLSSKAALEACPS